MFKTLIPLQGKIDRGQDTWLTVSVPAGTKMQGTLQYDGKSVYELSGPLWSGEIRVLASDNGKRVFTVGVEIEPAGATEEDRAEYERKVREYLNGWRFS